MRTLIKPSGPLVNVPFSQAVRHGNMIFISGQLGLDENATLVPGGVGPETHAALDAMARHLAELGASMSDIAKTEVFLVDINDYAECNAAYRQHFEEQFPARATLVVRELTMGARVEIEAIAIVEE